MKLSSRLSQLAAKLKTAHRGFTMIELLIVIAILGILAVAVLSAINPIEQIDRGRDTGSRSDAEQLSSAISRFHALRGYYPWFSSAGDEIVGLDWTDTSGTWEDNQEPNACNVLEKLSSGDGADCTGADELQQAFIDRITDDEYNPLFVYHRGDPGDSAYICFSPNSGAFTQEAQERCEDIIESGTPADFPVTNACAEDDYHICLP